MSDTIIRSNRKHGPTKGGRLHQDVIPQKLVGSYGSTVECARCKKTIQGSVKLAGNKCRLTAGCKGRLRVA